MNQPEDSSPLVSVFIPMWNSEKFLGGTLESIVAQTYRPIEVLLVDDGSTDRTVEIASAFARDHPEMIRLVERGERLGPCRQRNRAIAASRGSLLCWLDADDLWLPTKVAEQVEILQSRPEVGVVFTDFEEFVDDTGRIISTGEHTREDGRDFLVALLERGCFVTASSAMFRRSALPAAGPYLREREFSYGDDYYLWMSIALGHDVDIVPRVLTRYRRHPGNLSTRTAAATNSHARLAGLQREFLAEHPEARRVLGPVARQGPAGWYALAAISEVVDRGWSAACLRYAIRALALAPIRTTTRFAGAAATALRRRHSARRAVG